MNDAAQDADDIAAYYARGLERDRLGAGPGALELARTQVLLQRYLPAPPAEVIDVGGGPGRYAVWLAECGAAGLTHETTLAVEGAAWLLPDLDAWLPARICSRSRGEPDSSRGSQWMPSVRAPSQVRAENARRQGHRKQNEHLDAHIGVAGASSLHDELRSRGARITKPLEDRPWSSRDFYVEALDGYSLCFSEPTP